MRKNLKILGPIILTVTLSNVVQTDGEDNQPGIAVELLYNVKDNLTTIPELPAVTDDTSAITIDDDFVITAGKPFKKIEVVTETGEVSSEWVGEKGGGQGKYTLVGYIRRSAAAEAMFRRMANSRGYFVITELGGVIRLIGDNNNQGTCVMKEYKGGMEGKPQGPGYTIEITGYGVTPVAPRFTGSAPIA